MRLFKRIICVVFTCGLLITMTSCSSSKENMSNNKSESSIKEDKREEEDTNDSGEVNNGNSNTVVEKNQKIIKRASATIETTNFDESIEKINKEIMKLGGYIESSSAHGSSITNNNRNRRSDLTIRIPSKSFDIFMNSLGDIGYVPYQDISTENITSQYVDAEARVKSLKIQEERLLELLKQGKELKDILEIENQLSEVRYKVETYTGSLKQWDNLIDYSTVTLYVQEVDEILIEESKPKTLSDKIIVGFKNSLKNIIDFGKELIIFIFVSVPYLIIVTPMVLIVRYILKRKGILKNKKQ